jgi:hypothetical protein
MDVIKMLRDLYNEKRRLDAVIATLEAQAKTTKSRKWSAQTPRRGRKSMTPQERLAVSRRMTLYWENRRAQASAAQAAPAAAPSDLPDEKRSSAAGG